MVYSRLYIRGAGYGIINPNILAIPISAVVPTLSSRQEIELIQRSQKGDRFAFDRLIQPHLWWMYSVAVARVHHRADAEDVVQNTLSCAWKGLSNLREPAKFPRWLYKIVLRQSHELLEKRRVQGRVTVFSELSESELNYVIEKLEGGSDPQTIQEQRLDFLKCLHQLPAKYQEVLYLRYLGECSWEEIGAIMDLPRKTVEMRIHRGRKLLRKLLAKQKEQR
ncbi:MAG: RNA polymerase sigma factor [bacterium]|nr:RNA polymerase sigma factor [bacterium]